MAVDGFKMLPGGLKAAVVQMDADPIHTAALGKALRDAVEYEAEEHAAPFNKEAFRNVIKAVNANEIQAWFLVAGWDVCQPKIVGATIGYPTVLTKWNGNEFEHRHAFYQEDTAIPFSSIKELMAECPNGKRFPPDIGLGQFFEEERMRLQQANPTQAPIAGRVGEYSPHNSRMKRIMELSGASLGSDDTASIFELKGSMPNSLDRWKHPVALEELYDSPYNPKPLPHVFTVSWADPDNKQRIVASFTKGISTFTGETVIRTQVTSNRNLPDKEVLKHVMASILSAGQEEAVNRKWGAPKLELPPSPIISIHGGTEEALAALIASNKVELLIPRKPKEPILGYPPPTMRIHALGEPQIIAALNDDLPKRVLGVYSMLATEQAFEEGACKTTPLLTGMNTQSPLFCLCA